jgi:hypothetical protein
MTTVQARITVPASLRNTRVLRHMAATTLGRTAPSPSSTTSSAATGGCCGLRPRTLHLPHGGHGGRGRGRPDTRARPRPPAVILPAIATGGDRLTDGRERVSSFARVVEHHDLANEAVYRALLRDTLGLVVLENTEPYGIQHIDC